MDFRGFSTWEWLALSYFVDYGIEANVLRFMAGFTLIWFNSCQLRAPSCCLCFAGHLDRFGPDNAQLLEIFLDISHQRGSGVLYQKCLFPGAGASGELSSVDVTHLSAYRIQTQHEYTAHFWNVQHILVPSDTVPRFTARYSTFGSCHWNYSFPPCLGWPCRHGHSSNKGGDMQTRGLDGFSALVWRLLEELEGMDRSSETKWRLHPWTRLPLSGCDVLTLLRTSTASRPF